MPAISVKTTKRLEQKEDSSKTRSVNEIELDANQLAEASLEDDEPISENNEFKVITIQPTISIGTQESQCKEYMKQAAGCCFGLSCIALWITAEIVVNIPFNLLC